MPPVVLIRGQPLPVDFSYLSNPRNPGKCSNWKPRSIETGRLVIYFKLGSSSLTRSILTLVDKSISVMDRGSPRPTMEKRANGPNTPGSAAAPPSAILPNKSARSNPIQHNGPRITADRKRPMRRARLRAFGANEANAATSSKLLFQKELRTRSSHSPGRERTQTRGQADGLNSTAWHPAEGASMVDRSQSWRRLQNGANEANRWRGTHRPGCIKTRVSAGRDESNLDVAVFGSRDFKATPRLSHDRPGERIMVFLRHYAG